MSTVARRHRVLAAAVASVLFLATVLAVNRWRLERSEATAPVARERTAATSDGDDGPSATPSPAPSPEADPTLGLAGPDAAAALGAERLLASGLAAAQGPWRELGDPAWPTRGERPVYVADVELDPAGERVDADLVIATRVGEETNEIVLRFLPAAEALGTGTELAVAATVDGRPAEPRVDRAGARLVVPLARGYAAGEAVLLRLDVSYRLVEVAAVVDDGGPAAFGLLADHGDVAALGHWLPLLTLPGSEGPMVPWGDVGGFPVAIWSVATVHDGTLVTGGQDAACPDEPRPRGRTCTRSRGIALRDVSAALLEVEPVVAETVLDGVRHRAIAPSDPAPRSTRTVLDEVVDAAASFTARFGPLAWRELDTVSVPLGRGAAGMEFPGLSFIDDEQWDAMDGGFGTAVVVHEVAHQWFHALVGNGSLSDPVVDESLAQYLSVLAVRDRFGDAAGRRFADRYFGRRYVAAQQRGIDEEPPAQPLDGFADADVYGVMVYARAPLAWVLAEDRLGVEAVEAFVAELVSRYGLAVVTDADVVRDARSFDPVLGEVLERVWLDPRPLG